LRGTIYRDMAATERAEAHGRAARLLAEGRGGPARIAEHLLVTVPAADAWTVEQLRAAAREAAARGAPESAVAYLRRALAEPPPTEVEAGLLLELGFAEFIAENPGWHDHLEGAVEASVDRTTRVVSALAFANVLGVHERAAEAVEVCDRVAANLDGRDTEDHLMLEAVAVSFGRMDATTAPALAERGAVLMERARRGVVPRAALAVAAYQAALANQPANEVAALAHRAIIAGTRPIPDSSDPLWFVWAVTSLFYAERYGDAQTLFDAALREAQAAANGLILPVVLALSAWLALRRGDLTAAEADAHASLDAGSASGQPLILISASTALVETLIERGDLDGAERALEPIADRLQGISQSAAMARHVRGRLRFSRQRFSEALGDFLAAGEITLLTGAISPAYLPWRSAAALSAVAIGERDEARRLSDEEVDLARAFGAPRALGVALRASGLVAGGQRGETLLREAIEVLSGPDTRLEQARAQTDLGALLRRGNQRVEARQPLRRAIDTAHHLGAATLAERAESELRVAGAKPRRVFLTGLEALTASERRIAELAANGLTNREIAQTLFITDRTVEGHLTHVFTKLGVKTRTALAAALNAPTQAVRS
jgi:DNA-binding CsgD family transcriptional regulator